MSNVLIKIIPLDLAATLSPGILALVILVLASKNHPRAHALGLFLGITLVGAGISIIGFSFGKTFSPDIHPTTISAIVEIILGLFFVFYGLKIFFSKEKKITLKQEEVQLKIFKWFAFGLIIAITNFDAVLLTFAAGKLVGNSDISDAVKWTLLLINVFFFTLPATLPMFFKLFFPEFSKPILIKINDFMTKYSRIIILGMFIIFGLYFFYKGMRFFV